MQLKSVKLTNGIFLEIVTVSSEVAFAMKNQNKCLKHIYLNYWQSYWAEKGTKMTGRDHKISILKFLGQQCGLKVAKDKKHRKFGRFLHFLALFERFLASSSSETTWSTWKLRNSDSLSPSSHFDTLYNPVPLPIVNWIKNQFCLPQCGRSSEKILKGVYSKCVKYIFF